MIQIKLLDGSILEFQSKTTGYDIAYKISPNLAENSYAIKVNGNLLDLNTEIEETAEIEIITNKQKDILLPLLRHDLAHLLAQAVKELFPETKFSIGPSTENGFFYDFFPKEPFKEADLEKIEAKMYQLIDESYEITRVDISKEDALKKLQEEKEDFKIEILKSIDADKVSFYKQGNFEDLCKGPHLPNTNKIPKHFKLTKVSAVYWQGDVNNPSMQRIYGIGFLTKKDLDNFISLREELEQRDHRKIGKEMGLFHMQEEAAGNVFWHEKGWKLYRILENYIREKIEAADYKEVKTPQLINRKLWEKSGHWDKFQENMFVVNLDNEEPLALKPMNCPGHVEIFKQSTKSYKDLPLRMSEFGCCHRNEPSGALHGIMRVRAFVQDDAHIFCTEDQVVDETKKFCALLKEVYNEIFGDVEIIIKFSDRPEKRSGDDATWDRAEKALLGAAKSAGLEIIINKGEGAFYGPKLEFVIKDALGRDWQLGTLQADFILPQRLGAYYIGQDGNKYHPVMLHRAILGSLERFIGIFIEHYKGRFPLWICPTQVVIATVSDVVDSYAKEVFRNFKQNDINVELDSSNNKISYKIREHTLGKVPIIIIVGKKEMEEKTLTLRIFGQEKQLNYDIATAINLIKKAILTKQINYIF